MSKTKMTYLKFTLSFIICLISYISFAQTKSSEVKTINGKKFYIHKVEKGQSLYAIAKVYNMDVNSILAENDEAIDGLKPGQELKIPFETLMPKQTVAIDTNKYIYHKVTKGETVYAITKKYGIDEKKLIAYNPTLTSGLKEGNYVIVGEKKQNTLTSSSIKFDSYTVLQGETVYGISKKLNVKQDDLIKWNPELKDGVKQGQVLKVVLNSKSAVISSPPATAFSTPTTATVQKDTIVVHKPKKTTYTVGLFLPFKLSETETINIDELARVKANFPATQSLAVDFYTGFKKAVDSLSSKDFEVTIRLFDSDDRDSARIENICKTDDFKSLDAVFGPLYLGIFKIVAKHAKNSNIPVVSPVIQQNKILFENPLASKVTPSLFTLIEGLADFSLDSLSNANFIIVNTTAKDQAYIKTFKTHYNECLVKHNRTLKDSIVEVRGIAGVKTAYVAGKKNVVVLLTNNQVYLQDFITQLSIFSDKKDIVMMGFANVANIDNLDQEYLNALQFHFASPDYLNYKDTATYKLSKSYQDFFTSDPSEYYFQGFDVGIYYLSNLKNVGPDFFLELDKYPGNGIANGFYFYRPDTETGFENRAVYIYRYANYQLQKTKWK